MKGIILYIIKIKKKFFLINIIVDILFLISLVMFNVFLIDVAAVMQLAIGGVVVLVCLLMNSSVFLAFFYAVVEDGFLQLCSTVSNGIRKVLIIIYLISELAIIKSCIFVMYLYKTLSVILGVTKIESKITLTGVFLISMVGMNVNLLISLFLVAITSDKNIAYVLACLGTFVATKAMIKVNYFTDMRLIAGTLVGILIISIILINLDLIMLKRGNKIGKTS